MPLIVTKKISPGDPAPLAHLDPDDVTYMPEADLSMFLLVGGMESGKSSVALDVPMPDGKHVVCETSLAALQTAVSALLAMDAVGF